jgi:hypothetical protein
VPRAIPSSRSASARWSSTSRSFSACSRASRAASSRCHLQQPVTVRVIYIINQVVKIVSKQLVRGIIKACKSKRAIPIRIAANRQRRQSPSHNMCSGRPTTQPHWHTAMHTTLAHCHAHYTGTLPCMPHWHTAMHATRPCTPDCDAPQTAMHPRLRCTPDCDAHHTAMQTTLPHPRRMLFLEPPPQRLQGLCAVRQARIALGGQRLSEG